MVEKQNAGHKADHPDNGSKNNPCPLSCDILIGHIPLDMVIGFGTENSAQKIKPYGHQARKFLKAKKGLFEHIAEQNLNHHREGHQSSAQDNEEGKNMGDGPVNWRECFLKRFHGIFLRSGPERNPFPDRAPIGKWELHVV